MYRVEAFFFPTKIILVDDDKSFLSVMSHHLSKYFQVETYHDPRQALEAILKNEAKLALLDPSMFVSGEDQELSDLRLDLKKIQAISSNKEKNNIATVVIADFQMPDMNGIQLFEKLSHASVMKILLTGNADLQLALDAFNRGLVNKFLVKNTEKMLEEIIMNVRACQHSFFERKSYPLLSQLNIPCDSLINRSDFSFYFANILKGHEVSEYYLLDIVGSFLLITKTGKVKYLICTLERQFDEHLDVAIAARASSEVIVGLKKRSHAPVFTSEEDYKLPVSEWAKLMHSFERKEGYYCCFIG